MTGLHFCFQVPEQDETYKEDSFVVESQEDDEEEEEESAEEAVELMPEDSFVDGRRQLGCGFPMQIFL